MKGQRFTTSAISALAEEYHNLTPEQRALFQEAGEKATEAHRAGLQPFERAPKQQSAYPSLTPTETLRPGDVTSSGAIVSLSEALQCELGMQYTGADQFLEGFQRLKRTVNQTAKREKADCTLEDVMLLKTMSARTEESSFVEWTAQGQHTEVATGFQQAGSRLENLFATDWFPSVASASKAGSLQCL